VKRRAALALMLALGLPAAAQAEEAAPKPVLQGGWAAVAGKRPFQGSWSAEITTATPDAAQGSWTLVDDKSNVVMQGTWSANKGKGWRGAWSARIAPSGNVVSGTWEADPAGLKGCKTFVDMLQRGSQTQITGTWRAGHARGTWWLRPLPQISS
jgi:hypothetical protein